MSKYVEVRDVVSKENWISSAAELIATFCFVFVGAGSVVSLGIFLGDGGVVTGGNMVVIALAHGLAIGVMISATGRISGAHINPAVTFAAIITCNIGFIKGLMYIGSQLLGATLGALTLASIIPNGLEGGLGSHALGPDISVWQGLLTEIVLTFILVFVIFSTAMDPRGPVHIAPFAIGFAVAIDIFMGLPLTGASMNPARTLGPALVTGQWADHWVYWLGPLSGASIAAGVYCWLFSGGEQTEH